MIRAGRRATLVLALVGVAALPGAALAQPWARYAVPDSSLPAALRAGAAAYEAAWNALLVAGLRAESARADSARRLNDLATRIAAAEPEALGSRIAPDAMALRKGWSRANRRVRIEAAVAESLANAAESARDATRADSLYREALARYTALGEKRRRAWMFGNMGRNAFAAGDYAYSDSLHRLGLAARRELGDQRMVGNSLNSLGSVSWQRGRFVEARDFYREARAVREGTGERAALSQTLSFLGLAWRSLGEPDSARAAYDDALAITSALGDSARTLDVLVNLMDLLGRSGDLEPTLAVERRALAIAEERGLADRQVQILINASHALYRFGHFGEARQRMERAAALSGVSPALRLDALSELGRIFVRLGDPAAAGPPLERALALADSLGRPAQRSQVLANLVGVARLQDDLTGATRLAEQSLEAAMASGDSTRVQASLTELGRLALDHRDPAKAAPAFARAEPLSVPLGPQIHATSLNNLGVATLQLGDRDRAHAWFARSLEVSAAADAPIEQAFALLGLGEVAEQRGDFNEALARARAAATLVDTTRAREGSGRGAITLSSEWRFAFDALIHLLVKLDARSPDSGWAAEAYHWAERARARALLDLLSGAGGAARPLTLDQARAMITEKGVALLEYSTGDSSTTLWVITRDGARHHTLPRLAALSPRVEILRRGLADPDRALARGTLSAARALHRELIEPALGSMKGVERLIVSPDGPLALIPFEVLLAADPREDRPPDAGHWLGARFAVSYAFSAASLAARRGPAGGSGIVTLAAPDYGGALPALPETDAERASLASLAADRHIGFAELVGAGATRSRLLALPELPRAGLVHIATHGVADEVEPDRSGLWLAADSAGAPGFLSAADVSSLKLSADLVTLSACETGLGRLERGEGVVGLTRSFVAAGARSVVVSLWRVSDVSTARLMERFYRELLAKGRPRDRALAEARRALVKDKATRSPFHWAGFVLVGETGPVKP